MEQGGTGWKQFLIRRRQMTMWQNLPAYLTDSNSIISCSIPVKVQSPSSRPGFGSVAFRNSAAFNALDIRGGGDSIGSAGSLAHRSERSNGKMSQMWEDDDELSGLEEINISIDVLNLKTV